MPFLQSLSLFYATNPFLIHQCVYRCLSASCVTTWVEGLIPAIKMPIDWSGKPVSCQPLAIILEQAVYLLRLEYIFALNKTYLFVTFFFKSQAIFFTHLYGLTDP